MRIAIYGAGGAGGYFGAMLARAGENVVFIARGPHLEAIRANGLILETPGGEIKIGSVRATDDPVKAGVADFVLVGVKAWQVEAAARAILPMVGTDTLVIPMQNGVEAAAQLAAVVGTEHVAKGLCGTMSWISAPGRIKTIGQTNFIKFAKPDNRSSKRVEHLRVIFERAGVNVEIPENIETALWEKFAFVVSVGGVGAVTRMPVGVLRALAETRAMYETCVREIGAVGRARGVALPEDLVGKTLAIIDGLAPSGTASMHRDIVDGKPSELEAWNGAVVRLGREAGVETPLNAFMYHSLLPSELRARGRLHMKDEG